MAKRYVALLRGINVGGRNKVPMADLRETFEDGGYQKVSTYIQSGNVLFDTASPQSSLEGHIESLVEARFGIPLIVVVRSHGQMRKTIEKAPPGFGARPDTYHSDAIFLKAPLTGDRVMEVIETREGVDRAWPGDGVAYFQRLSAERTKSRLSRIASRPEYQLMTIRSWSTTTKLLDLLHAE